MPEVVDEVASEPEMMDEDVPGLGDTGDLMLIEKWHARFSGLKLQSAGVEGQLICNRSNLNCLFKLEARTSSLADVLRCVLSCVCMCKTEGKICSLGSCAVSCSLVPRVCLSAACCTRLRLYLGVLYAD